MRRLVVLLALALVAGCGGGTVAATAAPQPTPTYTRAQVDACSAADLTMLSWDDNVGQTAYSLYWSGLGDLTVARRQAEAAAKKYAALAAKFTGTGADAEVTALRSALADGVTAFAKLMTEPSFDESYRAIEDARHAFSDRCDAISYWVSTNVAQ